jgi:hypothetical protein
MKNDFDLSLMFKGEVVDHWTIAHVQWYRRVQLAFRLIFKKGTTICINSGNMTQNRDGKTVKL